METVITSYCRITNSVLIINGEKLTLEPKETGQQQLTDIYKRLEIQYPKFHKMDGLCKLGVLATEAALMHSGFLERHQPDSIAILLSNKSSSLDTDRTHQHSISNKDNYFPSPSVFVYTLPNIVIGEIAIKHKITGENAFFVAEKFDSKLLAEQNLTLLKQNQVSAVISGWVDYENGNLDALIYLTEIVPNSIKNSKFKPLNDLTIKQFYY
jgi:3-oxoacyl-(acyl-carrier-protein) synthase